MSFAVESWLDVPMFLFREKTFGFTASKSSLHIGEKPGVWRNHFQKDFENFSERPGLFAHLYYTVKSATLRTNCPFGFGLRHFAADQNVKMSF